MSNQTSISAVNIQTQFKFLKKGEIDKIYSRMYETAKNIAEKETNSYLKEKVKEIIEKALKTGDDSLSEYEERYKRKRISFHMRQQMKLLEIYAKQKIEK